MMHEPKETLGVFIHLYYAELADEISRYLASIPCDFAIYVSTDTKEKAAQISAAFAKHLPSRRLVTKVLPNRGWDIAPFISGFADEIRKHPFGLKIHAKKSDNQKKPLWGLEWRTHLLSELVGSRQRVSEALNLLEEDPKLGMIAAPHWAQILPWVSVGANYPQMKLLLARIGVEITPKQKIDFPSGSMFWFRREALEPLLALGLKFEDFDAPSNQSRDATLAHAIERSLYFFCEKAGFTWRVLKPRSPESLVTPNVVERGLVSLRVKTKLYSRMASLVLSKAREQTTAFVTQYGTLLALGARWLLSRLGSKEKRDTATMMWCIERSGLFDRKFYLEQNPYVGNAGIDPLFDYVTDGWRRKTNPQPLFDSAYYIAQNLDVAKAGTNPLYHYITHGWLEGRPPHPDFDGEWYRRRYRDVRDIGAEPLWHYLKFGKAEGRRTRRAFKRVKASVAAPDRSAWGSVARLAKVGGATVDVIVPVYRGYDETLACIYSVLSNPQQTKFELVVINDAGPDAKLNAMLQALGAAGYFTYLTNKSNLGFVESVNRGIALHEDRDVILLNSDAIVYGNWVDRMLTHARADDRIATITPFSNNATICSYPKANIGSDFELEVGFDRIDQFASEVNSGSRNEVPTGVGFCFFMKRTAIRELGALDGEIFGRGYGEENDFCMRAVKTGYRNVLAHDIFVYHAGAVSFSEAKQALVDDAQVKLHHKHPAYPALVKEYSLADPSHGARARIDARRLAEALRGPAYLYITHVFGGGIDRNINDLIELSKVDDVPVVIFRVGAGSRMLIELPEEIEFLEVPNLDNLDVMDAALIADVLKLLAPKLIHVHSVAGLNREAILSLFKVLEASPNPYVFTWHDHMPLCHRIQFMLPNERYCGEPPVEVCRECLRSDPPGASEFDPAERREVFSKFLARAAYILCPSHSAAERAARLVDAKNLIVKPHMEPDDLSVWVPASGLRSPLKVAVIGAILAHKGANLLVDMAADADAKGLPIEYVLIGYTTREEYAQFKCVKVTGKYSSEREVFDLLSKEKPHLCFLPSIWPETYSYTLSMAFQAGVPPVVFDIGAQAERVRAAGWGRVLPAGAEGDASIINNLLISLPLEELWAERTRLDNVGNPGSLAEYYSAGDR